jgi:hypothetical protein
MTELESLLRSAMHAAVDDEQPPANLTALVLRRHRRRYVAMAWLSVAICVAVAIAVLPAFLLSRGRGPGPTASRTSTPGHTVAPKPVHQPLPTLHGISMPPGSDVRLLLSGSRLAWYSTAARRLEPITGLPSVPGGYTATRVQLGYAVTSFFPNVAACVPGCGAPSAPAYYIADGARVATRIGSAFVAAPSGSASAVWLVSYPRQAHRTGPVPGRAQLVSLAGRPIGGPVTLPAGAWVVRGVGGYLLLQGSSDKLWDPSSRRVVRTFGQVDAVGPDEIAWGWSCNGCPVNLLNVRTGSTAPIAIPRGSWAVNSGAFSPDGTLLAIELSSDISPDGEAHSLRLGVVDLTTGLFRTVPGTKISTHGSGYLHFGWQTASHRLIVTLARPGAATQIGYWQPGATHLYLTTAPIPRDLIGVLDQ